MAGNIQIVTDSSAQFLDASYLRQSNLTILPLHIQLADRTYREGVDIDTETFFRKAAVVGDDLPTLVAPPVEQIASVYEALCRDGKAVIALHLSRSIHNMWAQATHASQTILGRCEVTVLDSQTISIGLGMLVTAALKLCQQYDTVADVVRLLRKLISCVYSVFYVENLSYLRRGGLLSESQALLGTMLGIKPFITMENGDLMPMEKVKTRHQAIDKLIEYATEFDTIDHMALVYNPRTTTETLRSLNERLTSHLPHITHPALLYKPSLGCFLGTDAVGMVICASDFNQELIEPNEESAR